LNPKVIEATKKYFHESVYLAITEYHMSYFEIMKMPVGFFLDLLNWKFDFEEKKLEEMKKHFEKSNS
jgi:hypothetical protein